MANLIDAISIKNPSACAPKADLERVLKEVTVYGKPVLFCNGYEQDACSFTNTEGKRITEISRGRLIQAKNADLYMNLVLHEYYVHLGLESTNRMLLSKGCLDALSAEGTNVAGLMNQVSPLSSLEQQMSEGKIVLQTAWSNGSTVQIHFAKNIEVPRCRNQFLGGGDFVTTTTNCSELETFRYSVVVQHQDPRGEKSSVAFTSKVPFSSLLTGTYDISTGDYTLSAQYANLETWTNDGSDDLLHPTKPGRLTFVSKDHQTWQVELSAEKGRHPFGFTTLTMTPALRLK
jgi:hypothetical protein